MSPWGRLVHQRWPVIHRLNRPRHLPIFAHRFKPTFFEPTSTTHAIFNPTPAQYFPSIEDANNTSDIELSESAIPLVSLADFPLPLRDDGDSRPQMPPRSSTDASLALPKNSADLYSHFALPDASHYIRVLALDPLRPGSTPDSPLTGSLHVRAWAEQPRFSALSIVWGMPSNSDRDTLTVLSQFPALQSLFVKRYI